MFVGGEVNKFRHDVEKELITGLNKELNRRLADREEQWDEKAAGMSSRDMSILSVLSLGIIRPRVESSRSLHGRR